MAMDLASTLKYSPDSLRFEDWGEVEYSLAVERQLALLEQIAAGIKPETIVFCSHPSVVTLGRSSTTDDLQGWTGAVVETSRGGKATYHGPGQIVIYPLINLSRERFFIPSRDIHAYLRELESALVSALHDMGVQAEGGMRGVQDRAQELLRTGVWIGQRKVASVGVAVKKWITYHGAALNVWSDPQAFKGIQPCGFSQGTMLTLEELGQKWERERIIPILWRHLRTAFELESR